MNQKVNVQTLSTYIYLELFSSFNTLSYNNNAVAVPTGPVVASPISTVPSVLVHPMNPARQQQVVSSGTGPIAVVSQTNIMQITPSQIEVTRPSSEVLPQSSGIDTVEIEQNVVSSSDDPAAAIGEEVG